LDRDWYLVAGDLGIALPLTRLGNERGGKEMERDCSTKEEEKGEMQRSIRR